MDSLPNETVAYVVALFGKSRWLFVIDFDFFTLRHYRHRFSLLKQAAKVLEAPQSNGLLG